MSLELPTLVYCCESSDKKNPTISIGCQLKGNLCKIVICDKPECRISSSLYLCDRCTCIFCKSPVATKFLFYSTAEDDQWLESWATCNKKCYDLMEEADNRKGPIPRRVQICSGCDKTHTNKPKLSRCGRCHATRYCNKECQAIHWKKSHKTNCKEGKRSKKKEKEKERRRRVNARLTAFPAFRRNGKFEKLSKENMMQSQFSTKK